MGFLHNMKLRLSPPKIVDPVFGKLVFMPIEKRPELSYWEGEWKLPGPGYSVGIFLPGGEDGPTKDSRRFYLDLSNRIERVLEGCRLPLAKVFREWLNRDLPEDMFSELKLTGVSVEDPNGHPLQWSVCFETTGEKWLGITVQFVDDVTGDVEIDT